LQHAAIQELCDMNIHAHAAYLNVDARVMRVPLESINVLHMCVCAMYEH
jgi:hypothetical protein